MVPTEQSRGLPDISPEALHLTPLERSETIPSSWYTDARVHSFEQDVIFSRTWQYAAHERQLPNEGDFLLATIGGNPIILVRGKDQKVRAFYNVCRHRGGPLAMEECGTARMLQCKYHGWTYKLDGTLRGVPRFDRTELFDKKDYGLVPIEVQAWQGLLFVCLEDHMMHVGELVDGIEAQIAPIRLDGMHFYRRVNYEIDCNWKVYVDNYLEGYHIPLVHPELCKLIDYRSYRTETFEWYSLQHSPFRQGENIYSDGEGAAFYYWIFPNCMLNILPGRLQTNRVVPLAPDRCRVVFDYFYEDISSPEALESIEEDIAFSDRIQQEDAEICEHVQRGLESRAYDRGRFSVETEKGVYHFQCLLKQAYRAALLESRNAARSEQSSL